jgi:hypothetical protein
MMASLCSILCSQAASLSAIFQSSILYHSSI